MSDKVQITVVLNPFDVRKRVIEEIEHTGKSVRSYVDGYDGDFVYSLDGGIVEMSDSESVIPEPGSSIVLCPVPHGGGGEGDKKSNVRMLAYIALSIYVGGLASVGTISSTTAALVIFAGQMLINAALPIPDPTNELEGSKESPSYGLDGPKNTSREGIPVPVPYGTFRMGGNLISAYIENKKKSRHQQLYLLFNAGEGPQSANVNDIYVNDQPIKSLSHYSTAKRRGGSDNDNVIPWFDDVISPITNGQALSDTGYITHTTLGPINKFRLDFVCPSGLLEIDEKTGKWYTNSVTITMEFKKTSEGAGAWREISAVKVVADPVNATAAEGEWVLLSCDVPTIIESPEGNTKGDNRYEQECRIRSTVTGETRHVAYGGLKGYNFEEDGAGGDLGKTYNFNDDQRITGRTAETFRASFISPSLELDTYDIRVKRENKEATSRYFRDKVVLADVNEIVTNDVTYKNTALLALKIRMTDQISSLPKVTYMNYGVNVWTYDGATWTFEASNNPAWVVWDMFTNTVYGGGMDSSRFNLETWQEWAQECTDKGYEFNGIFDTNSTLWDAAQIVARVGHAQILPVGTRYTVVMERAAPVTQMFSVANMLSGSFDNSWIPKSDRANEIEVSYFDKNDFYKQHSVKVYDEDALAAGQPLRLAAVTLFGITDTQVAHDEAKLILNINKYINQMVSFDAYIDSIASTVGDVIYVQHDMPQWGFAGRLETGSTSTVLQLDRTVYIELGNTYKLLIHRDSVSQGTGTVIAKSAGAPYTITVSTLPDNTSNKRLVVGGVDYRINDCENLNTLHVEQSAHTAISVSDPYEVFNTDVIEERTVDMTPILSSGDYSEVTVTAAFSGTLDQYSDWMFGESTKVKKPFRIAEIKGGTDLIRTIVAQEYNETIYDPNLDVAPIPDYSSLVSIENVTEVLIDEELAISNGTISPRVVISWEPPEATESIYRDAEVYVGVNGELATSIGLHSQSAYFDAAAGDELEIIVVAIDLEGSRVSFSSAPVLTYTVVGKTLPPADVTGLSSVIQDGKVTLSWSTVTDLDFDHYEIRLGADWPSSTLVGTSLVNSYATENFTLGSHNYLVKAIDTSGVESVSAAAHIAIIANPQDVPWFQIEGSTLNWGAVANQVSNLLGYEIRYQFGNSKSFGDAIPLHSGYLTEGPYSLPIFIAGQSTLMIKAVSSTGIKSKNPALIVTDFGDPQVENLFDLQDDHAAGFTGTITGGTIEGGSGDLIASAQTPVMWANADGNMWGSITSDMWATVQYGVLTYEKSVVPVVSTAISSLIVNATILASTHSIDYRPQGPDAMWAIDSDELVWGTAADLVWAPSSDYQPWPGRIIAKRQAYDFRFTLNTGVILGRISQLSFGVDLTTVEETIGDLSIAIGGTRLSLTKGFTTIKSVNLTLQDDGGSAKTARVMDKSVAFGPLIQCFDDSQLATTGEVDIIIKGY